VTWTDNNAKGESYSIAVSRPSGSRRVSTRGDYAAFIGLSFGQIGDFGARVRSETLVLTQDILDAAYKSGNTVSIPAEEPPYLTVEANPSWPAEYPQGFQTLTPAFAGYSFQAGGTGSPYARGYFAANDRCKYDFHDPSVSHPRGLIACLCRKNSESAQSA
jgi:hypothetical protein